MAVFGRNGFAGVPGECGLRMWRNKHAGEELRYHARKLCRHGDGHDGSHESVDHCAFCRSIVHRQAEDRKIESSIALPLFSSCTLTKKSGRAFGFDGELSALSRHWSSKVAAMMDEDEAFMFTGEALFPKYLSNTTSTLITFLSGVAPRMLIIK